MFTCICRLKSSWFFHETAHVLCYLTFPGKPGQPGHPGYMNLLFYKVKTKTWQVVSLEESYGTEDFHLKICDTSADLKRGQINIRGGSEEVAENLALVFSVCLLHVFLQPRPANWEPGESLVPKQRLRSRGTRRVRHINAESVALIMAAGLLMATPSNHFIRKRMKDSHMAGGFGRGGASGDREDNEGEGVQEVTQVALDSVFGESGFGGGGDKQDDGHEPHDLGTDYDVYGEDINTFLGDIDTGATEGVGDNDGGGCGGFGNDGDGGGCGGCGGGGGFRGDLGGGGGDSGGGGGIFGGGFSGGAFGDSDGDGDGGAIGGGGGWLDGFCGMDSGGGSGWGGADSGGDDGRGGWGDGGGRRGWGDGRGAGLAK